MKNKKLKELEIEELEKWPAGSKNKFWYWIKHGCLAWGLPVGILVSLFEYFTTSDEFGFIDALIKTAVFVVFGLFYGMWIYSFNNKRYMKYIESLEKQKLSSDSY